MAQPARFAMLEAVTFDSGLTFTARTLYLAIHVRGRDSGVWSAHHSEIARELRLSERDVRRRLAELQDHGYVRIARGRISLEWTFPQDTVGRSKEHEPAKSVRLNRPMVAALDPHIKNRGVQVVQDERTSFTRCACGFPQDGPEPRRCVYCQRPHYPEQAEREDALPAVVELLHGYVAQCGLQWPPPDEAIAHQALAAAGGVGALHARLRGLMADRARPQKNYAWFPAVVRNRGVRVASA